MKLREGTAVAFGLALFLPLLVHAQMYKCVDERGATRYADQPGPGCKATDIRASPPISGQLRERRSDFATQDADFKRRHLEDERRAAHDHQALEQRCAQLRREQGVLASGGRVISSVKPDGERLYMDDAVRDQRLASVREQLRTCP